jgi:hypothetical protein
MTVYLYPGNPPSNVTKEAKYSVVRAKDGWGVRLIYSVSNRQRDLLTTTAHPQLSDMVNRAKVEVTGDEGGAFYINEYGHVLVPSPEGVLYAGSYHKELEFDFEGTQIRPTAPDGLRPGDVWVGPRVGIRYVLNAGGDDVYYEHKPTPTRTVKHCLSDDVGRAAATHLARRLARVKGTNGGRIYINERCEFFAPVTSADYARFLYLGHLEDDTWFTGYDMD